MHCELLLWLLAAIVSLAVVQGIENQFSYVVGQNASIPCPNHRKPYKFIKLMFTSPSESSEKIYTIDFRNKDSNKIHPSTGYEGRVLYKSRMNIQFFTLINLVPSDEGVYECRLTPHDGSSVSTKSTQYVIEPASEVIIKDSTGKEVDTLAGPYNEKEFVQLTCVAIGGRPAPKVTWFRNGKAIKSNYSKNKDKTKSTLKIGPLRRNHTRFSFHCTASNHERAVVVSKPLNLNINTIPTMLKFISDDIPLVAGKDYQIECLVEGSKPPAKISWTLDRTPLPNHMEYVIDENETVKTSTLTFTPKVEDAGKQLRCYAKNPEIPHEPITIARTLVIHYPPTVILSFFPKNIVNEGDPVRLDCKVRANPQPFEVLFYKGHDKLYNINNYLEISNRSVTLVKTTRKSSGAYSCVARNNAGYGSSVPQSLRINHEPQCKTRINLVGASRHETVDVKCLVDSWPAVTNFHWQFNRSGEVSHISSGYTSDDFTSVIQYTPKDERDFGSLLCWAKNAHGNMKYPCVYTIVKAELPDRLENCTQVNRTAETFFVACVSGRDGGLPQKFIAELFDTSQHKYVLNVSSEEPQFFMEELSQNTLYFVTLFSQNSKGHSEKVTLHVNTSSIADRPGLGIPTFGSFPLTPVLSVLIGVVAVLALVALITAGIMHMRGANDPQKQKKIDGKQTQLLLADSEKGGSDKSGMPTKLKTPNLYVPPVHDSSKEQKRKKVESAEVEYAEVTFTNKPKKESKKEEKKKKKKSTGKVKETEEDTLYASIDYNKMNPNMPNAAIIGNAGSNGKPVLDIPPPPKDQVATSPPATKVTAKLTSPQLKSILSKKSDKPPIPAKPANLPVPASKMALKESSQAIDQKDLSSKETIPLMQKTLESNL